MLQPHAVHGLGSLRLFTLAIRLSSHAIHTLQRGASLGRLDQPLQAARQGQENLAVLYLRQLSPREDSDRPEAIPENPY
jgi:hypothetical protein